MDLLATNREFVTLCWKKVRQKSTLWTPNTCWVLALLLFLICLLGQGRLKGYFNGHCVRLLQPLGSCHRLKTGLPPGQCGVGWGNRAPNSSPSAVPRVHSAWIS